MGVLNFETDSYHRRKITAVLQRRGLVPDLEQDWEILGPHHPELPYQVYVGYAIAKDDPTDCPCVAISLHGPHRGVYEIDDPSCWGETRTERKISTIPSAGVTHNL